MMTHAYLKNLCRMFTAPGSRFVFANSGSGKNGSSAEKDDDEKKKEEEEKKKKEETEKDEKKKKEDEENEKKKKAKAKENAEDEDEDVETTTEKISRMAKTVSGHSEQIAKQVRLSKGEKNKEIAEKFKGFSVDFGNVVSETDKASNPTKDYIGQLVTAKKIPKNKAKKILALDPLDPNFDKKFEKLMATIPELEKNSAEVRKIKELKEKEGKKLKEIDKKLKESMEKFRALSQEMADTIDAKAQQEKALKSLRIATGLNVEAGQILVYKDEKGKSQKAKIKEVGFEDIEITDDDGNVLKKIPSTRPKVVIESVTPNGNKIEPDTFTEQHFHEWVDESEVYEDLDSMEKLKKSLGFELKKGAVFEYQEVIKNEKGETSTTDVKIEVKDVNANTFKITLDQEVLTAKGKKKELGFGEFAKWFKQKEAAAEIETIEKLRQELYSHREMLNAKYPSRSPSQYPPIEAKEGEVLYYDDDSGREFVINKINEKDKKITFDTGKEMSFTGFLRWVKREEVEKKEPDAEAKKRTEHIGNPEEKAKAEQNAKAAAEREIAERKEKGKDKLSGYVLAQPEEHAAPSKSYLGELWKNTYLLSISDLAEMGKTIFEWVKRRLMRRQKGRVGAVGQWMFGHSAIGAEFKTLSQSAENEEVNHHVHTMETMGITDIKNELHHPPDKDTLKAAITVMCKKGQMRWDDREFWHGLSLFSGTHINPENYMEDIKKIIDGWWGDDAFNQFRSSQSSSYNSTKKNFEDDAKRLENDPKGLKGRLQELLFGFIHGETVHPCEYEAYLHYAFGAGKMVFEDKMFFFIMGIGTKNPAGETLLHIDRVAAMEGELLATVPLIDFFVSPKLQAYDDDGKPLKEIDTKTGETKAKTARPNVNTFRYWINNYILPDLGGQVDQMKNPKDLDWNSKKSKGKFSDFVRDVIAWDPYARVRMEKASRNPENWDHDDMDMFVQLLNEGTVDQILRYSGGARMQVSFTGLKNAIAGLNEFMKRKINTMDQCLKDMNKDEAAEHYRDIITMVKSFIRFDATISSRYVEAGQPKVRFTYDIFNATPSCSDKGKVIDFITDMRDLVRDISKEIGLEEQCKVYETDIPSDKDTELKKQAAVVKEFGTNMDQKLTAYMDQNGIEKVAALLGQNHLRGMGPKITTKNAIEQELAEAKAMSAMSGKAGKVKAANDNMADHFDLAS